MFAGRDDVEELAIGRNGEIARSQPDCGQLIASGRADWEEWPLPKNSLTRDISFCTLLAGQKCGFLPVSAACLPPFLFSRSPAGNANLLIGVGFSGHVRGCGLPATVESMGPAALRTREQVSVAPFCATNSRSSNFNVYLTQLESTLVKFLVSVENK